MNHPRYLAGVVLLLALGAVSAAVGQESAEPDPTMGAIERQLETGWHEPLLARIAESDAVLTDFSTDGCSGGLSTGWEQLSGRLPEFATRHGEQPPWEVCCVAHDRQYHAGGEGAESPGESFDQRKQADLDLKICVVETGVERSAALEEIYELTEAQIRGLYEAVAELMYRAVRLGGIPCTDQPWRWGYGWPRCR